MLRHKGESKRRPLAPLLDCIKSQRRRNSIARGIVILAILLWAIFYDFGGIRGVTSGEHSLAASHFPKSHTPVVQHHDGIQRAAAHRHHDAHDAHDAHDSVGAAPEPKASHPEREHTHVHAHDQVHCPPGFASHNGACVSGGADTNGKIHRPPAGAALTHNPLPARTDHRDAAREHTHKDDQGGHSARNSAPLEPKSAQPVVAQVSHQHGKESSVSKVPAHAGAHSLAQQEKKEKQAGHDDFVRAS